jgi:hypothetical protein
LIRAGYSRDKFVCHLMLWRPINIRMGATINSRSTYSNSPAGIANTFSKRRPSCPIFASKRPMYVRITVFLANGQQRSGIRHSAASEKLENIQVHAARLSADALGREAIKDVRVEMLPATDPSVVAILSRYKKPQPLPERSTGEHPFTRDQWRKPRH